MQYALGRSRPDKQPGARLPAARQVSGWFAATCVAILQSIICLALCTRNNDFPTEYHPDETSKVLQIGDPAQPRNFNQPLLLVESANLLRRVTGVPAQETLDVAMVGRRTSACFASLSVFSLALSAYAGYGFGGVLLVGTMLPLCPALVVHGHYFKEDVALVLGIAVSFLGARLYTTTRGSPTSAFSITILGIGCGLSASAKYVGVMMLVVAVTSLVIGRPHGTRIWPLARRIAILILAFASVVVSVNGRAIVRLIPLQLERTALARVRAEFIHGTAGQDGIALTKPNTFCLGVAGCEIMPHVWGFLIVGVVVLSTTRHLRRLDAVSFVFICVPTVVLCFNANPFPRYALPLTVLAYLLAGEAAVASITATFRSAGRANIAVLGCMLLVVSLQGVRCINVVDQFRNDSRQELREWVARHIPRGSRIAIDSYALLDGPGDPFRFPNQGISRVHTINSRFAADAVQSVNGLVASRIDFVVVAAPSYERFFVPSITAVAGEERLLQRRREFYRTLSMHCILVWQSEPASSTHSYVNPDLRLYKVLRGGKS